MAGSCEDDPPSVATGCAVEGEQLDSLLCAICLLTHLLIVVQHLAWHALCILILQTSACMSCGRPRGVEVI